MMKRRNMLLTKYNFIAEAEPAGIPAAKFI
jgi:hypothetical protein